MRSSPNTNCTAAVCLMPYIPGVYVNVYRFEKQKREQELQATKHLDLGSDGEEGGSGSESDSETEDEDAEMLTPALDLQVK